MSRHRLFLDSETQVGKNKIFLPAALSDYYKSNATAYVNGRQVPSVYSNPPIITDGLLAYYKMDDTASGLVDETGNHTVSSIDSGINTVAGKHGNGFHFDGSEYIQITSGVDGWFDIPVRSVSLWFKAATNQSERVLFLTDSGYSTYGYFKIRYDDFRAASGANRGFSPILGEWNHVVAMQDHYTDILYFNGNKIGEWTGSTYVGSNTDANANIVLVAARDYSNKFTGDEDDLRIYNRLLSASEIDALYRSGSLIFDSPVEREVIEIGIGNFRMDAETENRNVLSFDKTNDYVNLSTNTAIDFTGSGSVHIRFKTGANVTNIQCVVTKGSVADWGMRMLINSGELVAALRTPAGDQLTALRCDVSVNSFYDVFFTFTSGEGYTLEVNGGIVDSIETTETTIDHGENSYIGKSVKWDSTSEYYFGGEVYYTAFYDGDTKVIEYEFDEGGGSIIYDSVGSNNGTITSATWTTDDVPIYAEQIEVLHWTPASETGYYWVLTEDEATGNSVWLNVAGTWKEGQLWLNVSGTWKQASDVNVKDTTWK